MLEPLYLPRYYSNSLHHSTFTSLARCPHPPPAGTPPLGGVSQPFRYNSPKGKSDRWSVQREKKFKWSSGIFWETSCLNLHLKSALVLPQGINKEIGKIKMCVKSHFLSVISGTIWGKSPHYHQSSPNIVFQWVNASGEWNSCLGRFLKTKALLSGS